MTDVKKPLALIILDGWGYSEDTSANAIYSANTPTWDRLWRDCPHTLISGSGMDVGLPDGQMGNSEVGHMTLGAGRVVYQNLTRINKAIADRSFYSNPAYSEAIDTAIATGRAIHIFGLLSPGGVHSHEEHIAAALKMATERGASKLFVHAFLDGRDTPPRSAASSIAKIITAMEQSGVGRIASITGRYYAMDRDQRWERTRQTYAMLTDGSAEYRYENAVDALQQAYQRGETDEFVKPTILAGADQQPVLVADGDVVLFMNFRPDRARQLTQAFVDTAFAGFARHTIPKLGQFVTTTEYEQSLNVACAFPPVALTNSLGEYLASLGKSQLRIAETEKYAHVTFFFNGGREDSFPGEDRVLVPSPKVATYDLQPEMSAPEVTDKLVAAIQSGRYDLIVCNFANGDMVGHTGIFSAAIQAVETLDHCLAKITSALEQVDGECLITADHGNVESMLDGTTGQALTAHTLMPVPLVYVGHRKVLMRSGGSLADVAPTLLYLSGITQPAEMTGRSLATVE